MYYSCNIGIGVEDIINDFKFIGIFLFESDLIICIDFGLIYFE